MSPRPFFSVLHDLLDREREVRLGELLSVAGEQTYGLLILLLALPSLVPGLNAGVAPLGGAAVMAIGYQLGRGVPHPWVPRKLREVPLHKGAIKAALARLERLLERYASGTALPRPISRTWMGACVAWTGLLLALPVPLPFGNILPASILCLLGAAILEQRPAWAWAATLASLANTIYFVMSLDLVLRGLRALCR